jgi:hypothetical protein
MEFAPTIAVHWCRALIKHCLEHHTHSEFCLTHHWRLFVSHMELANSGGSVWTVGGLGFIPSSFRRYAVPEYHIHCDTYSGTATAWWSQSLNHFQLFFGQFEHWAMVRKVMSRDPTWPTFWTWALMIELRLDPAVWFQYQMLLKIVWLN